jgi:uncharacterized protein involved in exopolysaccharide biosynthesis
MSNLAAQFGIPVTGRPAEPPDLYITLLKSRDVLRQVVLSDFSGTLDPEMPDSTRMTLIDIYKIDGDDEENSLNSAVRILRDNIRVSTNIASGVVTLRTTAPSPLLAEQANRRILETANDFNIKRRSDQSSIERAFIADRLGDVRTSLRDSEGELESFLVSNRSYATSPPLLAEYSRLQRQTERHLQVYISLAQAYEQAKIDEVRNTAVISVIDPPEGSALPSIRLFMVLFITGIVGLGIAISAAFIAEYFRRERLANPEAVGQLNELYRTAISRLTLQPAGGRRSKR